MSKEVCPCCGASMKVYSHKLNHGLLSALWKLYQRDSYKARLKDLDLNHNQFCNFQKLQYWGIVESHDCGFWSMTYRGVEFVQGRLAMPSTVRTYRGEYKDTPEDAFLINFDVWAVDPEYKKRVEYAVENVVE